MVDQAPGVLRIVPAFWYMRSHPGFSCCRVLCILLGGARSCVLWLKTLGVLELELACPLSRWGPRETRGWCLQMVERSWVQGQLGLRAAIVSGTLVGRSMSQSS